MKVVGIVFLTIFCVIFVVLLIYLIKKCCEDSSPTIIYRDRDPPKKKKKPKEDRVSLSNNDYQSYGTANNDNMVATCSGRGGNDNMQVATRMNNDRLVVLGGNFTEEITRAGRVTKVEEEYRVGINPATNEVEAFHYKENRQGPYGAKKTTNMNVGLWR